MTPSLDPASLAAIPLSFASVSIGCKPSHTLPAKIDALAKAGFRGIELGFPDLQTFASLFLDKSVGEHDYDNLVRAAEEVKRMCEQKGVEIMLVQPFANFEGWLETSPERREAWKRANGWLRILIASGCETLQVRIHLCLLLYTGGLGCVNIGFATMGLVRYDVYAAHR